MTRLSRWVALVAGVTLLSACAGDVGFDGFDGAVDSSEGELERSLWESAPPGCEEIDVADVSLYACEGEPLLGALVDPEGAVLCVDAMSVLIEELRQLVDPLGDDPSPQPSYLGPVGGSRASRLPVAGRSDAPVVVSRTASGGSRPDPTPTPVVHADPTPTRVTDPVLRDPTPTPVVQPEPDEADPTPTPTMEPAATP